MKKYLTSVRRVILDLMNKLTLKYKQDIRNCENEDLIGYHNNLGRIIRNDYGLWHGNEKLLKDCLRIQRMRYLEDYKSTREYYKRNRIDIRIMHPDDASMVILREFKRRLQKC